MVVFYRILLPAFLLGFLFFPVLADDTGEEAEDNPGFLIELGGELFYGYDTDSQEGLGGLAAIMIDMEGRLNKRVSMFGAFHFDSSVWHDFMNRFADDRTDLALGHDVELEVEEFFVTFEALPGLLDLTGGRMFSVLSYANQLHLADFQFNMKPRIFTDYWGDNHGYAVDGLSAKLYREMTDVDISFIVEAAKGGHESEHLSLTGIADAVITNNQVSLGLRAFAFMDHQYQHHPMLYYLQTHPGVEWPMQEGFQVNAYGGGMNMLWDTPVFESLFLQTEWLERKWGDLLFTGGYAFAILSHSDRLESSFMYQQLQVPGFFSHEEIRKTTERAYTAGISFYPWSDHRLRLEYSTYDNSMFYDNMLLLKYTFFVDLMR